MLGGRGPAREGLRALARELSVTRVARLTGLDRTGVEVASAVRPLGHVLQVTNGKGASFEDASLGALLEAAELAAAEHPAAEAWGSASALAARLGDEGVVYPAALDPEAGGPGSDDVRLAWRSGVDLLSGRAVLVPSHVVHAPPPGAPSPGPALVPWTSNGMAAAPSRARALLHAVCEVVERDRLARALPLGFTEEEVTRRLIGPRSLARVAPRAAALAERIAGRGFGVYLFDLGGGLDASPHPHPLPAAAGRGRASGLGRGRRTDGDFFPLPTAEPGGEGQGEGGRRAASGRVFDPGLPCAAAVIAEPHGPVPVAAGYACRLRRDDALVAALLEAAQSRATEIHGAREDVAHGDRHAAAALAELCARARPSREGRRLPDLRARSPRAGLRVALDRLRRAGVARAVAVDLGGPTGVAVVKVIVPGLLLSELLR